MWAFVDVVRTEENFGRWETLVTLERGGVQESFFLNFTSTEPTAEQVTAAAMDLVVRKNTPEV